jgi:hypothetical protein
MLCRRQNWLNNGVAGSCADALLFIALLFALLNFRELEKSSYGQKNFLRPSKASS